MAPTNHGPASTSSSAAGAPPPVGSPGAGEPGHTPDGHVQEASADDYRHASELEIDHHWYKRAVFYEVLVRAFNDSDGNGTGDLRGLTEKLDYLQWLGVDCLWLPPFYDSPLRDGGYDIRDFRAVLPEFGTVEDLVEVIDQAHRAFGVSSVVPSNLSALDRIF